MAKRNRKRAETPEAVPQVATDLLLTLSVNRQNGRIGMITSAQSVTAEADLKLLLEALSLVEKDIRESLLKLAEQRGREAAKQEQA